MKLDILCFAAHPDDVELACSGTILRQINLGYKVGIIDLTQGELGTRGNAEIRAKEADTSSKILGIHLRENLKLADGFFRNDTETLKKVIEKIRCYQPEIILCNAENDRHIDHGKAANLIEEAGFLSGLQKIETNRLQAWRAKQIYHYIQDRITKPDLVVDISDYYEKKMQAVMAYSSQFYNPESNEPTTAISSKDFLEFLNGRALEFGRLIGKKYGEGFTCRRSIGTSNLMDLI